MAITLEVVLRTLLAVPPVRERLTDVVHHGTGAELRWYYDFLGAKVRGVPLPPGGVGAGSVHHPALGWLPAPGVDGVDAQGRRDPPLDRPPEATRVVLVGDSFTYGLEVPVDDTFGAVLERRHPDVDVVNLGVFAYGLDQVLLRTELDVAALDPDVVVLVTIGDDVDRSGYRFYGYAKPWFTLEDGVLALHGQPVPGPRRLIARVALRPRTVDVLRLYGMRAADHELRHGDRRAEVAEVAAATLDRWHAVVAPMDAVPVLVHLPTPRDLETWRDGTGRSKVARDRAFVVRVCAGRTTPCVDGFDSFDAAAPSADAVRADAHWNAVGHAIAADIVEGVLAEAGLLPEG